MRISHFCFALDSESGGVPAGVIMTAVQLTKFGISNQIISLGNTELQLQQNANLISQLNSSGVGFRYTIARIKNDYGVAPLMQFKEAVAALPKPDFIVLHQIYSMSTILGFFYARKNNIPYAVKPHGSLTKYHESDSKSIKYIAKKVIISKILLESNSIIVTCNSEKSDLPAMLQAKTTLIPYGSPEWNNKNEERLLFGKTESDLRIIFIGRFDKKKNLPVLIKSLPKVIETYPNLILDIAGSGTAKEVKDIERLVSSLNLESNVCFHGWIDLAMKQKLLKVSRLLVLPSENENFAVVVSEALSLGIPCVLSKFVGTADIVARYQAGVVLDQINPSTVADAIMQVIQGDSTFFRNAALQATRVEFDWKKISMQWKVLISSFT